LKQAQSNTQRNANDDQSNQALTNPASKRNGMSSKEEFKEMFPTMFNGVLGCVKDERVHLDLDPNVKPVRPFDRSKSSIDRAFLTTREAEG
jgi:hypothetical protein